MAEKPLARRLDDIEAKLDSFIENQDKLLEVMSKFESTIKSISDFEDRVKKVDTVTMQRHNAADWISLADYCIRNNFDADKVMEIMRIFTYDFFKDKK